MNSSSTRKPRVLRKKSFEVTLNSTCDICGKHRGGSSPVSHMKCSKIRQNRPK